MEPPFSDPSVTIVLDRPRVLRFDLQAMARYEQAVGFDFFTQRMPPLSLGVTLNLSWACLVADDPALTVAQLAELVGFGRIAELRRALVNALNAAFPTPAQAERGNADGAASTAGAAPPATSPEPAPPEPAGRPPTNGESGGHSESTSADSPTSDSGG